MDALRWVIRAWRSGAGTDAHARGGRRYARSCDGCWTARHSDPEPQTPTALVDGLDSEGCRSQQKMQSFRILHSKMWCAQGRSLRSLLHCDLSRCIVVSSRIGLEMKAFSKSSISVRESDVPHNTEYCPGPSHLHSLHSARCLLSSLSNQRLKLEVFLRFKNRNPARRCCVRTMIRTGPGLRPLPLRLQPHHRRRYHSSSSRGLSLESGERIRCFLDLGALLCVLLDSKHWNNGFSDLTSGIRWGSILGPRHE